LGLLENDKGTWGVGVVSSGWRKTFYVMFGVKVVVKNFCAGIRVCVNVRTGTRPSDRLGNFMVLNSGGGIASARTKAETKVK
jgi:hypothetical protein